VEETAEELINRTEGPMGGTSRGSRNRRNKFPAAIASVGLTHISGPRAEAGLLLDLRAAGINGVPVVGDRKNINFSLGDTVTLNLVGVDFRDEFRSVDREPSTTPSRRLTAATTTPSRRSSAVLERRRLEGRFLPDNQGNGNVLLPVGRLGWSNGITQDFDSDGDLDLGAGHRSHQHGLRARMCPTAPPSATRPRPRRRCFGVTPPIERGTGELHRRCRGPNTFVADTRILDTTTAETLIGEVIGSAPAEADRSRSIRPAERRNVKALWFEDGTTTGKNPTNALRRRIAGGDLRRGWRSVQDLNRRHQQLEHDRHQLGQQRQ
jgi:hypothetical protein